MEYLVTFHHWQIDCVSWGFEETKNIHIYMRQQVAKDENA